MERHRQHGVPTAPAPPLTQFEAIDTLDPGPRDIPTPRYKADSSGPDGLVRCASLSTPRASRT